MYTIYKHINKINNKIYIGVTKQKPEQRWAHGEGYKNNTHFYSAIKQYGWNNFDHFIIEQVLTIKQASQREKYWIKYYNSTNPDKGYNLDQGGYDGRVFSEQTRKKMSESHKGEKNSRYNVSPSQETKHKISQANKGKLIGNKNPMYGKTHSKEAREKIKKANQHSKPNQYKAVRCITTGLQFKSIKQAKEFYNLGSNGNHISQVCKGKRNYCGRDPQSNQPLKWEYIIKENNND